MNQFDFSFEQSAWELALERLKPGSSISAVRLLTLMEDEDELAVEEALQRLEDMRVTLDVFELPVDMGSGEQGKRLQLEAKLAKNGQLPEGLEGNDPLRLYLEEIAGTPAAGDPVLLAERVASGDQDAAQMLLNVSLHQVFSAAKERTCRGVLLLDLMQEGSLGLWQGILNWQGGEDFTAYSRWWIEQAMAKAITLQARAGGIGTKMRTLLESYRSADKALLTKLGRNPTLEEIALELNLGVEDAALVEKMLQNAVVLDQARQIGKPKPQEEEEDQAVEDTAYFQSRQRVLDMLSELEELDAKLLTLRFGLEGGLPLSPQEAGAKLGLTPEEVVSREAAALMKLRKNG